MSYTCLSIYSLALYIAGSTPKLQCTADPNDDTALLQYRTSVYHDANYVANEFQLQQGSSRANMASLHKKLTGGTSWLSLSQEVLQDSPGHIINDGPVTNGSKEVATNMGSLPHHAHKTVASNDTRDKDSSRGEYLNPFVNVDPKTRIATQHISPEVLRSIVYVHVWLGLPVLFLWTLKQSCPDIIWVQQSFLPIVFCACLIAQTLANQALVPATTSSFSITACQFMFLAMVSCTWCVSLERQHLHESGLGIYARWLPVTAMFILFQIFNHIVSEFCSLSERIVLGNLTPIVLLVAETFAMPADCRPTVNIRSGFLLTMLVVGAIMFNSGSQNEDIPSHVAETTTSNEITSQCTLISMFWIATTVSLKLGQRHHLKDGKSMRIGVVACIDSVSVAMFSILGACYRDEKALSNLQYLFEQPWLPVLLALSCMTHSGVHLLACEILRNDTATALSVLYSISGFLLVAAGVALFGDKSFTTPTACVGISVSLLSALWYSVQEAIEAKSEAPEEESQEDQG